MTLSTSDTDNKHRALRTAFIHLAIAIFTALFGAVYENYSHGVYSYYMIYAFAFPLVMGTLPYIAIALFGIKRYPSSVTNAIYNCAIATLTLGSILQGVLVIYGTSNTLVYVHIIMGAVLVVASVITYFAFDKINNK